MPESFMEDQRATPIPCTGIYLMAFWMQDRSGILETSGAVCRKKALGKVEFFFYFIYMGAINETGRPRRLADFPTGLDR